MFTYYKSELSNWLTINEIKDEREYHRVRIPYILPDLRFSVSFFQ